ncbi:MAG: hypothetical protein RL536_522 [Candidatus Parcubacteria bacterium]|jgi:hypothetical protein
MQIELILEPHDSPGGVAKVRARFLLITRSEMATTPSSNVLTTITLDEREVEFVRKSVHRGGENALLVLGNILSKVATSSLSFSDVTLR